MKLTPYKLLLILASLFLHLTSQANDIIPDSLKKDAVAVVVNYSTTFVQHDISSGTYDVVKEVMILNKKGEDYGHFIYWGDKFHELKSFSGTIKDSSGKVIRKIKKGDLTLSTQSDMSTIASDSYYIYFECNAPSYPYTVEFTYQEKFKGGIIAYPSFMPAPYFDVSVESANYKLELPANIDLRYKENYNSNIKSEKVDGKNTYTMSVRNMKAIPNEPLSPSFRDVIPRVLIAPIDFCYDSQCGNMATWSDYGKWVSGLLVGRDVLKPEAIDQLKEITRNAKDDREKVKILYEYMQANSRYVSIQLGIGGFQPIEAEKVAKSNFGDCKGLANWMKAMLKAIGINSNYCEISTREDVLYPDFTNVSQTNHAILMVPLSNDTIWLECTSQTLPFGYIHSGIAGHDALVVKEETQEGIICKLPIQKNIANEAGVKLNIELNEDRSAKGNAIFTEFTHGYEKNYMNFRSNDRKKHVDYINGVFKASNVTYNTIKTTEERSDQAWCRLEVDFVSSEFATKTGSRMFIPLCPIYKGSMSALSSNKRSLDVEVGYGYMETDTVEYILPESYTLESIPKDINIESSIGNFVATVNVSANKLIYIQTLEIKKGRHSKEEYKKIKEFFAEVSSALKRKVVLKKL